MTEESSDLAGALDTAIEEAATQFVPDSEGETEQPAPEEAPESTPEPEEAAAEAAPPEPKQNKPAPEPDEVVGDLVEKLTPQELETLKSTPEGLKLYKGLMQSYTPRMQKLAEQERQFSQQKQMWDALNSPDEGIRRRAVAALAAATGMRLAEEKPKETAPEVDEVTEEMNRVFGPEAAAIMRPVFEKLAQKVASSQIQPLQQASEALQMDARARQAQAQIAQFRANAKERGWEITPDVEARMTQLGQEFLPARPIETVEGGVRHLEMLYKLATADDAEKAASKKVFDRMQKAAETAEPTRGVPSSGQERKGADLKNMTWDEAFDTAIAEARAEHGL